MIYIDIPLVIELDGGQHYSYNVFRPWISGGKLADQ